MEIRCLPFRLGHLFHGSDMKKEYSSFLIACFLALGVFALNHYLRGEGGAAYASVFSSGHGVEQPYSERARSKIRRNIVHSSDRILKLSGRDIYEVLDRPELVRRDLPTIVWQYRNDSCVLDVYFTTSGDDVLTEPVVHYEVRLRQRADKGVKAEPRACLSSLVKAKRRGVFSVLDAQAFYKAKI